MLKNVNKLLFRERYLWLGCGIVAALLMVVAAHAQNNPDRLDYIEKYKDIAISEMERAGVPASIKLAQGILESNSGKSVLARKANNHFGMKCGSQWDGKTFYREDDDYDEKGNLRPSCFRVYKNAEASFIAHSEFLRDPRKAYRYGFLFRLDAKDYKRWALGLKKAGYATNPRYPDLLIGLIEDYELYIYDNIDPNDIVPIPPDIAGLPSRNLILVNNIRTAVAIEGESVLDLANRTQTPIKRLFRYNEDLKKGNQTLEKGYRVFLQPKRSSFQGKRKYHYVKEGQTMMDISQLYGVKLKNVYSKNRIPPGKQPAIGEKIKLRGWRIAKNKTPKIRKKGQNALPPATIPVRDLEQDNEVDFDVNVSGTSIDDFNTPKPDTGKPTGTPPPPVATKPPVSPTPKPPVTTTPVETPKPNTPPANTNNSNNYYTVQAGDTLYRLSRKFGITVPRLKELNGLTSNLISVGQRLRIK